MSSSWLYVYFKVSEEGRLKVKGTVKTETLPGKSPKDMVRLWNKFLDEQYPEKQYKVEVWWKPAIGDNRLADRLTEDLVRSILKDIAWNAVGPKAFKPVVELVLEDVVRDVLDAGKAGLRLNYNAVQLAFGRALCKRLGIQED